METVVFYFDYKHFATEVLFVWMDDLAILILSFPTEKFWCILHEFTLCSKLKTTFPLNGFHSIRKQIYR